MLLSIFLISILASTNAGLLEDLIDKISKLNPLEQIPFIPNLISTVPKDALLTSVSETLFSFNTNLRDYKLEGNFHV